MSTFPEPYGHDLPVPDPEDLTDEQNASDEALKEALPAINDDGGLDPDELAPINEATTRDGEPAVVWQEPAQAPERPDGLIGSTDDAYPLPATPADVDSDGSGLDTPADSRPQDL